MAHEGQNPKRDLSAPTTRKRLAAVAVPATAYVVLMAVIAAVWVKPPLLGLIGFAIVALVGAALIVGAFVLLPRSRANMESLGGTRDPNAVVVLAGATSSATQLAERIGRHVDARQAEVHVVSPVLSDRVHFITDDDGEPARGDAQRRLDETLEDLRAAGIAATGRVGSDDPVQALDDAVVGYAPTEIVIVMASDSHWLDEGLLEHAREVAPSVEEIVVAPAAW